MIFGLIIGFIVGLVSGIALGIGADSEEPQEALPPPYQPRCHQQHHDQTFWDAE